MKSETVRLNSIMAPFNFVGAVFLSPFAFMMGYFLIGAPAPNMTENDWRLYALRRFYEAAPFIILRIGAFSLLVNTMLLSLAPESRRAVGNLLQSVFKVRGTSFNKTSLKAIGNTLLLALGWALLATTFWLMALACGCYALYRAKPEYFG